MMYRYTVYGLCVESSLPLPELTPATGGVPDVTIGYARVPESLPFPSSHGIAWRSAPGRLLTSVDGVARYLISDGREIWIDRVPGCDDVDVRTFLLGSVLAAVLHGRRMVLLHASAIHTGRGVVVFMGHCGAGKSTLAAALSQRGHRLFADDRVRVMLDETGGASAVAGARVMRLTAASARELNVPGYGVALRHGLDKYAVPGCEDGALPAPLLAAYAVGAHQSQDIRIEPLAGPDRFDALSRYVYRRRFVGDPEGRAAQFRILSGVAAAVPVATVRRPQAWRLADLCQRIEEDLAVR
jgi:hypothetical protein